MVVVILPSLPKQVGLVKYAITFISQIFPQSISTSIPLATLVQPAASVTVTVYFPFTRLVIVELVEPVFHLYV